MGISGLLPLLKKASKNSHIRKFSGCTAAIDAYCWLHKGAFGCAEKLGKGEPTTAYINYCMKYIQVLLNNNIKPILVLDGRNLPSKEHTEKKRRQKRDENRKLARKYLQEGKKKEAWECFTKCVDITPTMAREFIKVLRSMKIDYVVAPYEADAQLAYLAVNNIADIIITEDSDLILFGCPKIFFKMSVNGDGVFFDQSKLPQCLGLTPSNFKFDRFRWMCILSGCDYLPSLPGIGLGRAKKVILESSHDGIREIIHSIPSILVKLQVDITEEYIEGFIQAENTFLYQLVFDTHKRVLLPLNPYPEGLGPKDLPFAGSYETNKIAVDLALGNVDLHTLKTVDCFEPLNSGYTTSSIWSSASLNHGKRDFVTSDSKTAAASIGMQISVSVGSNLKKKRPLAVLNSDNEDNAPDDDDLMNMYKKTPSFGDRDQDDFSFEDNKNSLKVSSVKKEVRSPSPVKRRRINDQKAEETLNLNSPSCNTRSRNRVLPFLKSPDTKVYKSKYFKPEGETISSSNETKVFNLKQEEDDEEDDDSSDGESPSDPLPNLSIYSYETSSQDSVYSDISASQQSLDKMTTKSANNSESFLNAVAAGIRPCSVVIKKTDIPEIILDDDEGEEDDAYGSGSSRSLNGSQKEKSTPPFSSALFRRSVEKTPSVSSSTKSTFRRQGLSRSTKKDPKQPSVRDMFTRHKSVQ